jgi:hypothetical protein
MTSKSHSSPFAALRWLGGPIVWLAHLTIVYGAESLLCRSGAASAHTLLILAATFAALALLLMALAYGVREVSYSTFPGAAFMEAVAVGLALLGFMGVIWTGVVGAVLSPCMA